ncbi:MAG: nitroreductase family protein [Candidatus Bathyarchaeota archaeon]|nr:nitroreductase family protein [Candidatus Bathyarchaeota archaeon]
MELVEAIKDRRSIRAFKKQDVSQEAIDKLVEAALLAPSAGNAQSWAFVLVKDQATKLALSKAALGQRMVAEAPVVFVVCADEKRAQQSYGERGRMLYCIQDTAAATQNILLTACSLGLGACWVGAFREEAVRKIVKAPEEMRPVAMIPVGYPDESPPARSRRPASEVVYNESF